MSNLLTSHKISRRTLFKVGGGLAAAAVATRYNFIQPAETVRAAAVTNTKKGRITPADRKAAAARMAKYKAQGLVPQAAAVMNAGGTPDYFGTIPNWANSPMPVVDVAAGTITGGIRKFVDALPILGSGAGAIKNERGQYLPIATPDTLTYSGSDYYEISLVEYSQQMHADLQPTTLRGYVQTNNGTAGAANTVAPNPVQYLGPVIIAQHDRPVRVKFTNALPSTTAGGNLFIPCDTTAMGAGAGPQMFVDKITVTAGGHNYSAATTVVLTGGYPVATGAPAAAVATVVGGVITAITLTDAGMGYTSAPTVSFANAGSGSGAVATATIFTGGNYSQNRANVHLHGGDTVWISDGTPHQWITPANEVTPYPQGVSVVNVPDMPNPGPGSMTLIYSNHQSARLLFYHDHAVGITRLNVYTGAAAGYVVQDPTEQILVNGGTLGALTVAPGTVPAAQIPLVIQDRTFLDPTTLVNQDPTWPFALKAGFSDLWFPHVYMPNQNPADLGGANACGRWDYGPWFWPPFTGAAGLIHGTVPNPLANSGNPLEGPVIPGTPNPSMVPEGFMDTMMVNGTVYPYLKVGPQAYRFRILNACNDRAVNLSLFKADASQAANPLVGISITNPGAGYLVNPAVVISGGGGGTGASALAVIDTDLGQIANITLTNPGSGYTAPATVTIAPPTGLNGVTATAFGINVGAGVGKEVKMIPAVPTAGLPITWPTDGRDGGMPDPTTVGPDWIQIGTEGGLLPDVAIIHPNPINYEFNRRSITVLNILNHSLLLMPAERADVIVDFSGIAPGTNVILYNDAPAPVPAFDPRVDYYTGCPNQTDTGGAPTTLPGYGPNTRTIMQFQVVASSPTVVGGTLNLAGLQAALPAAFAASQPAPIVPQARYAKAYPTASPAFPVDAFARIQDMAHTFTPVGATTPVTIGLEPKAIQELFEINYGRMNATLGMELPFTNMTTQTTIPFGYVDPPTEIFKPSDPATLVGSAGDGTQLWKITHNGVDTHGIHFHLFNVQVLNRVGWDGAIKPVDANELGWKDTVRMNPLEDVIVALRPVMPKLPASLVGKIPNSVRLLDPSMPLGATGLQFMNIDPNNNPITVVNQKINYGWEYVWHCHILGHEENDMMRAMLFTVPPSSPPTALIATVSNTPLRVVLSWTRPASVVGATSMTIQRCTDNLFLPVDATNPGSSLVEFTVPVATITYTDMTVVAGTNYFYRVMATNLVGGVAPGAPSLSASTAPTNTVQVGKPAAPSFVSIAQPGISGTAVVLTWKDNAPGTTSLLLTPPNDMAEKNFIVQRATNAAGPWTNLSTTVAAKAGTGTNQTYSDTKTLPLRKYYYQVMATNFFGTSAAVSLGSITTK